MKTLILNKKRIKTAAAMALCCLVLTSCWEDFDGKFTKPSEKSPEVKMASNCTLTTTNATLEWIEPLAVAYTGMRIKITEGTTTNETTVNRGTVTSTISLIGSGENTITLTAIYSTGYEIECSKFKITPMNKTLRFIYTAGELSAINTNSTTLGYYYILMADLDLSGYSSGTGWNPIGTSATKFTGIFDGNGHTIRNLAINDSTNDYKGLFGYTFAAEIKNLALKDVSVSGDENVGALAGRSDSGKISNCSAVGTVIGNTQYAGGLVGYKLNGAVEDSHASVNVSGNSTSSGGLIGYCDSASITNCYATGSVKGSRNVGGLIGYFATDSITNCYATGDVIYTYVTTNHITAGGLVGVAGNPVIEKCYALGDVTVQFPGTNYSVSAGSLAGSIIAPPGSKVTNCFARGNVDARITNSGSTATLYAGGLIGQLTVSGPIQYCYNTGTIVAFNEGTGLKNVNGFANIASNPITACYYNTDTTGRTDTGTGFTYLTTSQMKDSANYSGWDYSGETVNGSNDYWSISSSVNNGYPYLSGMVP
jgi:hypothetical protein